MIEKALFFGIAVAFLSCLYLGFSNGKLNIGKTLAGNLIGTVVLGLILAFIYYLELPAFVGIWGGWWRMLLAPTIIASVVIILISGEDDTKAIPLQVLKIIAVGIGFLTVIFTPVLHWNDLYNIPQVTEIDNISLAEATLNFNDPNHPRIVDIGLAWSKAHTVISDGESSYGSIYEIRKNELHMQKIKGHEFWIGPLEFQDSYGKWDDKRTSPGFVMVDAENPFVEAKLYTGYDLKYLPSAYWGSYLPRYAYDLGYSNVVLEDAIFEVTDNLEPYWIISISTPTVNNDGPVIKSVLVIDAQSGADKEYPIDQVPAWIDRVTPERIAQKYATWVGGYVNGWWNLNGPGLFVSGTGVNELTTTTTKDGETQTMYFVTASDGKSYWFSGMTSPSYSDQSLSSIVLVDSRISTRMIRIRISGANEQAAMDALNAKFSQNPNWYGTAIIPYVVYGELTYVIPIDAHTSSGNNFEGVGFVQASTRTAVVGKTKEEAAELYKISLAEKNVKIALSAQSALKTVEGAVERTGIVIISGQSIVMLWLNNSDIVFKVNSNSYPTASLTKVNDIVNMSFVDTSDTAVGVEKFTNNMVKARIGKDQIRTDNETAILNKQKETNWNVQEEYQKKIDDLRKGQ